MAAKNLEEALYRAEIKYQIEKALCIGPLHELTIRIALAEKIIVENLKNELRDYFAHQTMFVEKEALSPMDRMDGKGSAADLFDRIFKNISAVKGDSQ